MGVGVALAVGAAVTLADVAVTAVVVGTALTVAGAVTHNQVLSEVGMGLGIAGGIGGLAASAGLFTATAVTDIGATAAATSTTAAIDAAGVPAVEGAGTVLAPAAETAAPVGTGSVLAPTAGTPGVLGSATPQAINLSEPIGSTTAGSTSGSPSLSRGAGSSPENSLVGQTPSTTTPEAPVVTPPQAPGPPTTNDPNAFQIRNVPPTGGGTGLTAPPLTGATGPYDPSSMLTAFKNAPNPQGFLANLDPTSKAALLMAAGQGVSGGIGGIFTGMTADKQMALQTWMAQQQSTQFNQTFNRGNSAGGLLSFAGTPSGPAGKVVQ